MANLQELYPRCFAEGKARCGIHIPDSWASQITEFFIEASEICEFTASTIQIDQIKSKFGTLRIYYHIVATCHPLLAHTIDRLIRETEAKCENLLT